MNYVEYNDNNIATKVQQFSHEAELSKVEKLGDT